MGNEVSQTLASPRLYTERTVNPQNRLYSRYPDPNDTQLREYMHEAKHSKNFFIYYGYRGLQGALIGVFVGMVLLHPFLTHSPYVYRKFIMSLKPSQQLIPVDTISLYLKTFVPRYFGVGFTGAILLQFFSDYYDHVISSNKLMKHLVVGTFSGWVFGFIYGAFRYHWHGAGLGLLAGLFSAAGIPTGIMKMRGEFPPTAAEYMPHVTPEEIRRYEVQEARLMGFAKPRN